MRIEPRRLVLDANIMVGALIGRSFPLLLAAAERGVDLMCPVHQLAESHTVVLRISKDESWTRAQMQRLLTIVQPVAPPIYMRHEDVARVRLHARGQPDWPLIALAMAVDADIWSHDRDLFGTGAPVWSTPVVRAMVIN